ncbi:transcriptional regulator GcvA [Cupriavidus lacunae]|uniref:XRE family transcriptional regulator n=1 Tax=Cupriavidus lacunae TaxID=2666307 RepID=A0A370P2B6_9BURK|nr:transcriptional regulator GcvA [Cupriavidus lacunae]RDK11925.1 XRE family transcriptional regulator [Cupriavidus lacunae]
MRLPPLNTFRFFEVAARHRNFTRAAEELHVTHGAVSQQIKALEEAVGKQLFFRRSGEMRLTPEGAELLRYVSEAFSKLNEGIESTQGHSSPRRLTINSHPAFAARWLAPRLHSFSDLYPEMEIRVRTSLTLTNFKTGGIDLAIRFGDGEWPGLITHKLMDEALLPVCSPTFNRGKVPRNSEEIATSRLLHDERFSWALWFKSIGKACYVPRREGIAFTDANLLLQSTLAGHGIALGRMRLCEDELIRGTLLRLSADVLPISDAYYVVYPEQHASRSQVRDFMAWLALQLPGRV